MKNEVRMIELRTGGALLVLALAVQPVSAQTFVNPATNPTASPAPSPLQNAQPTKYPTFGDSGTKRPKTKHSHRGQSDTSTSSSTSSSGSQSN